MAFAMRLQCACNAHGDSDNENDNGNDDDDVDGSRTSNFDCRSNLSQLLPTLARVNPVGGALLSLLRNVAPVDTPCSPVPCSYLPCPPGAWHVVYILCILGNRQIDESLPLFGLVCSFGCLTRLCSPSPIIIPLGRTNRLGCMGSLKGRGKEKKQRLVIANQQGQSILEATADATRRDTTRLALSRD